VNTYFFAGCFVVAIALVSSSAETQAESRDQWCGRYARRAVGHFKEARGFNKCRRQDGRWHDDELTHFNFCKKAQVEAVIAEDDARRAHLASCKGSSL